MKYFIYHIPGKKIGVTRNLDRRVTQQQGYAEDEYEVLFASEDIDQISKLEIELQKSYGYPVDRTEYKNLFKSTTMKFKNTDWSVSGSKRHLKAFAKDLEDAGFCFTDKPAIFNKIVGEKNHIYF